MKINTTMPEDNVIINTIEGGVTFDEIIEYLAKNVDSFIGKPVIWDVGKADFSSVSSDEMRFFSQKIKSLSEKRHGEKTALVSAEDLPFGMMRVFQAFAELDSLEINFRNFRTIDEAKNWLIEENKL
jgi:hypothetical protein